MSEPQPGQHQTDCTLVLFTKRPRAGVGKQRVAAGAGAAFAFGLAERLFDCAAEDLALWPGPAALCIADAADADWAAARCPQALVLPQGRGNLGERLQQATRALGPAGAPLLFIGSDAPTLDTDYLRRAAAALTRHDVALGAASDGGVVAMGCRKGWPALAALPWSTDRLGAELAAACGAAGLGVHWLPAHTDIDTLDALAAVAAELEGDPRPARRALLAWLRQQEHEGGARRTA